MEKRERTHNSVQLKEARRKLRNESTSTEAMLWSALKGKQLDGWQWRRQFSIGPYILDFYCPKMKLGIELDGQEHFETRGREADYIRDCYLEQEHGIKLLRFENKVVWSAFNEVVEKIREESRIREKVLNLGVEKIPPLS